MSISSLCRTNVASISGESSIQEAAKLMKEKNIGDVIVTKRNRPIGILTDRDIAMRLAANDIDINQVKVSDVMSNNLLTIKEELGVLEAIREMHSKGVRRAPVINDAGEIVGIATVDDLLILISKEMQILAELIGKQIVIH